MSRQRPHLLLLLAFVGAVLAGAVPIAFSLVELSSLRSSVRKINDAASVAKKSREVAEKIALAVTDFTAVALEIDPAERARILAETDAHVADFAESVSRLTAVIKPWLTDQQNKDLTDAAESLGHSWEEIRDQAYSDISNQEKSYHFLQISDNAKMARIVLVDVEMFAANLAGTQTNQIFERLSMTGVLLIVAMAFGFFTSSIGSISIFRSLQLAQKANLELKTAEQTVKKRSEQLMEAQRLGKLGDWRYQFDDEEFWWAPELFELFGYNPNVFRPTRDAVLAACEGDGRRRLLEAHADLMRTGQTNSIDIQFRRNDGSLGDFVVTSRALVNIAGELTGFSGTIQDISERKKAEEQLERLAYYDPLTGLANRSMFNRRLNEATLQYSRSGAKGALLLLDLDRFKDVNDTLGHAAGDELLTKVAQLIARSLDRDHFVSRLGGDEFAVLLPRCAQRDAIERLADNIIAAVSGTISLERGEVNIGTSVGIVLFPHDGCNPDELLRNADLALYRAKEEGRGRFVFFQGEMSAAVQQKLALASDLRRAVIEGEGLMVHYQPLVDLSTGRVTGFESLLRWQHPTRGFVPPSAFIPIAESSRLICDLGLWILRHAATQAKAWIDAGEPPRMIAVNVSAAQIWHSDLERDVANVLAETGLPPHLLCLELTESLLADYAEGRVRTALRTLKGLGVTLALDDFGTAYSSLGYLTQLPFDKLKIDRVFVNGVADSDRLKKLLQGIIALGRGLGMTVVAEGVEKPKEVQILREFSCDLVQGYVFSRPASADEALSFARKCERSPIGYGGQMFVPDRAHSTQTSDTLVKSAAA